MNTTAERRTRAGVLAVVGVIALAACSGSAEAQDAAGNLPNLELQGMTSIDCADSTMWGDDLEPARGPYVQECWRGAPELPFDEEADDIVYSILAASDAVDVTDTVCPEDALYDSAAVACRAAAEGDVLYRVVVALTDPALVVGALPDEPTDEQIDEALAGASVEVLVATEEVPEASS